LVIWWTAAVSLVAQTPAENRLAATTKFPIRARLGVLFEEVIPVALVHRDVVSLGRAVARRAFSAFDVHDFFSLILGTVLRFLKYFD
jgi:hypothetical protein